MGEETAIEWADHTWNPWIGCTKVSAACDGCYAEDLMSHRYGRVRWGAGQHRVRTSMANWREPARWNRKACAAGRMETVFCLSLGDIWDNEVDPVWRHEAFDVMNNTSNLLYLLLSKRVGNAVKMCDPAAGNLMLPRNCALGATLENQEVWNRDIQKLIRAAKTLGARFSFASVEPMLGPIDARGMLPDWVIVGGESGNRARPMDPDWARGLRDQCAAAGVPYFFKQWGEYHPLMSQDGDTHKFHRVGKRAAGRVLDGVVHDAMPRMP